MSTRSDKPREYFSKLLDTPEEEIDYREIPPTTAADWQNAEVLLPLNVQEFRAVREFIQVRRAQELDRRRPSVAVRKSVTPDYLICLEDGKKLKMLKRHLHSTYNMTPDEYRAKWNLPPDYPMVAPKYAEQRSALAKKIRHKRVTGPRKPGAQQ